MRRLLLAFVVVLIVLLIWYALDESNARATIGARSEQSARAPDAVPSSHPASLGNPTSRSESEPIRVVQEVRTALLVVVVNEHGEPRAGVPVELRSWRGRRDSKTDTDGRARFEAEEVPYTSVFVDPGGAFDPVHAGAWIPEEGGGEIRVVLCEPRELIVHVKVDGVPSIPEGLTIAQPKLVGVSIDRAEGIVRGQFVAVRDKPFVTATAKGYIPGHARLNFARDKRACGVSVELSRAVQLRLRIQGRPEFARDISVAPAKGGSNVLTHPPSVSNAQYTRRAAAIRAGRYAVRLGDRGHFVTVQEFDVPPDTAEKHVTVDLRRAAWLNFKPILPEDYDLPERAKVLLAGRGYRSNASIAAERRVVHPGDREITATIHTPLLRPHRDRGSVTVAHGGSAQLEAEWCPLLTFRLAPPSHSRATVVYVQGDSRLRQPAFLLDGVHRCGPVPVGTYNIILAWSRTAAPTVVRNVVLDGSAMDLGTVAPPDGAMVRVRCTNLKQGDIVRLDAVWLDGNMRLWTPRSAHARAPDVTLSGVPRGTIHLKLRRGEERWSRKFECDGKTDRTIEVDCSNH
ncbi:MAG: hypothetical protein ACYTGZ_21405 [Planctomycetota bacterium]